jgi:hypothetical protein
MKSMAGDGALSQALTDIEVDSSVLECEGEPCLFVKSQDEFAATCRLKNFGVAIAEPFSGQYPSERQLRQQLARIALRGALNTRWHSPCSTTSPCRNTIT